MRIIKLIDSAIQAAILAGIKIREIYTTSDFNVELKADRSPLTKADLQANAIILNILEQTGLPVLSEEGRQADFQERKNWTEFWLVDPLDGTKEFISRNGEFTVNIALIRENKSIAGVVYTPVSKALHVGIVGSGAWKILDPGSDCTFEKISEQGTKLPLPKTSDEYIVAASRTHLDNETAAFIENLKKLHPELKIFRAGSSLKFCLIAEGAAEMYPRFGPTMEWDTAAGHALVKAIGKNTYNIDYHGELDYNKENLKNPNFIAV